MKRRDLLHLLFAAFLLFAAGFAGVKATPAFAQGGQSPPLLLRGGMVYDGTGAPGRIADVRVASGKIVAVGKLSPARNERVVNIAGRAIAPGFIDAHSHADGGLLENRAAETQIRQGITTAIVGQDGGNNFPLADWFAKLSQTPPALNIASFVGHGTVRGKILGEDYKRAATPAEVERMRQLVAAEMRAGALGLSSGLEYDPGLYSTTDEVIACAQEAAAQGGLYISHVRDEENEALTSFQELIEIAQKAGLPAQISHIKLGSSPVWGRAGDVRKMMADARKRGLDISADIYPYTFWQSSLIVIIPTRDWSDRAAWEKGLAEIGGAKNVRLTTYTPEPSWENKTIAEIAQSVNKDPVNVIQDIVAKTHGDNATGREGVVVTAMQETDLETFLKDPYIMFCTDGGLKSAHPRGAGSYPRVLGYYVREKKILSLPEAIRKMTSLPARRMKLTDRGTIQPGKAADLVVFDPKMVRDTATVEKPQSAPVGITDVLVNGQFVLENGQMTDARPGQVLRRAGSAGSDAPKTAVAGDDAFTLTVLHTNDLHGHILPFAYTEVERGKDELPVVGGAARRATLVQRLRREIKNPTILVDSGDTFTRGPLTNAYEGIADTETMNAVGYELAAIGNNEFKAKDAVEAADAAGAQAALLQAIKRSRFPWVCANATDEKGDFLTGVQPFVVRWFPTGDGRGIRVGFLGLTAPRSASYPQTKGWTISDPIAAAREWIPKARSECDVLIAVTHIGVDLDKQLAAQTAGIDAIVGGDSHTFLYQAVTVANTNGVAVPIVQTGEFGVNLGRFDLRFVRSGSGWKLADFQYSLLPVGEKIPEDKDVAAVAESFAGPLRRVVVGELPASQIGKTPDERAQKTTEIVVNALRRQTGADLALNPRAGGFFEVFRHPQVTRYDVFAALPFKNHVVLADLTGAQIKKLWQAHPDTVAAGAADAASLDDSKTYQVVLVDFIAQSVYQLPAETLTDTGKDMRDVVIADLQATLR